MSQRSAQPHFKVTILVRQALHSISEVSIFSLIILSLLLQAISVPRHSVLVSVGVVKARRQLNLFPL